MSNLSDELSPADIAGRIPARSHGQLGRRDALVIAGPVSLAFVIAYAPVVRILAHQWATNDTYSFGVLVPFISAYLIWLRREHLLMLRPAPSIWGVPMVAAAGAALGFGRATGIVGFQEISLVSMLMGLVVLLLGFQFLRHLWFPLAYLLLMLPVWEVVTDDLHHPSQLLSAGVAQHLLQLVGVPVHREQEYLQIPTITLQVASACSGVNFLIAVIAVGLPQVYLQLRGWLPRAAVMVFAVMIALLSNGLRVAIIGFLSYYKLSAGVHGPGHILQGLFVSSIGLVTLLACIALLARRYPRLPDQAVPTESALARQPHNRWRLAGATAVATVVLLTVSAVRPERSFTLARAEPYEFGSVSSEWRPLPGRVPARFVAGGVAEERVARVFQGPRGQRVELFIGNLAHRSPDGSLNYRAVALPNNVPVSQVAINVSSSSARVNQAAFAHAGRKTSVLYWYDLDGRVAAHHTTAKAFDVGKLLMGAQPTAKLLVVVSEGQGDEAGDSSIVDRFVQDVVRTRAILGDDSSR